MATQALFKAARELRLQRNLKEGRKRGWRAGAQRVLDTREGGGGHRASEKQTAESGLPSSGA